MQPRLLGHHFERAERPFLWEMFRKLDNRMTRYYSLLLGELYPAPRPRFNAGQTRTSAWSFSAVGLAAESET